VRIISGKYKGRHIEVRHNFPSRPTTDIAKENLFNILNNYFDFDGLNVLDLFAGTGSISYEFASRGAKVDLIELEHRSYQFIRSSLETLNMTNVKPYRSDVFRAIPRLKDRYDIIFADPPFQLTNISELPELIFTHALLKPGGWFILEHSDRLKFNSHPNFRELREYGSVNFSIFTAPLEKESI
jgi:16S rRNA (guanine966-N2)-methyltransferase